MPPQGSLIAKDRCRISQKLADSLGKRALRRVAIKFLQQSARGLSERFWLEAQATARCNHGNIVAIYEFGEHNGHLYMVLEYLEGQTLRQWLKEYTAATSVSS